MDQPPQTDPAPPVSCRGFAVERINPERRTRGTLLPREPLYVIETVSVSRYLGELSRLADDRD